MSTFRPNAWQKLFCKVAWSKVDNQYMELINDPPADRGNRLCVTVSDIHLTDGTVGFQNLSDGAWKKFYQSLLQRCNSYHIDEVLFVLDGDIVDIIRSAQWAEHNIYPWQREREQEFSKVVNLILKDIIDVEHQAFFNMLINLPDWLKRDAERVNNVKVVVTVGNHDKELLGVASALKYFYEKGLGVQLEDIPSEEREAIGRMYGDENMFKDPATAPYLPFYYGDTGFRFFTTHGQWRDRDNSRAIKSKNNRPGWEVSDGWAIEQWQQLGFSPFLHPCFGDSVAAGVLSTFIYKVKKALKVAGYHDKRLDTIMDELDLYRPTYAALTRMLLETHRMRSEKRGEQAVKIIQDTLYDCVMEWLSWDFTYQAASKGRRMLLKSSKKLLQWLKLIGGELEIKALSMLLKVFAFLSRHHKKTLSLKDMRKFPAFLPQYRHYGFQIHGEGHTHVPLQEEPNINGKHPGTYINFGTWRDQIVPRENNGYRRRGVLRTMYILDLANRRADEQKTPRTFDYFVEDFVHWADFKDAMDENNKAQPKI